MAAMSSGRKEKSSRVTRRGTSSSRKYRFESFNQRISKLNIDPIRRTHHVNMEPDDLKATTSYLQTGLDRWKDLNLSENFTNFIQILTPFCESLPQILHYDKDIMATLVAFIEKRDVLSLEPLLDLLGRFAHDLGVRFECHFASAVTLICSLATKHKDIQVIEWSFTCLAWLFKYLSRLLVPDLRPLFQIMAPLLGRESQKFYVTRFAAEAMSFLVKKAALVYHKNETPLRNIIEAILVDLESINKETQDLQVYRHGLMTLITSSIKSVDKRINSYGDSIYLCLISCILERNVQAVKNQPILIGVTVDLIHHTGAETFSPILKTLLQIISTQAKDLGQHDLIALSELLFVITAVRKGSRVHSWSEIINALVILLELCKGSSDQEISQVFKAAAVILHSAALEAVIPRLQQVMNLISSDVQARHFLLFSNYICDLDHERFQNLVLPYFSQCALVDSYIRGTC